MCMASNGTKVPDLRLARCAARISTGAKEQQEDEGTDSDFRIVDVTVPGPRSLVRPPVRRGHDGGTEGRNL
jgi:hypothetical protein